jgi:hypothetical protein
MMMDRALIFFQIFALLGTTPHVPNGGRMVGGPYVVTVSSSLETLNLNGI